MLPSANSPPESDPVSLILFTEYKIANNPKFIRFFSDTLNYIILENKMKVFGLHLQSEGHKNKETLFLKPLGLEMTNIIIVIKFGD